MTMTSSAQTEPAIFSPVPPDLIIQAPKPLLDSNWDSGLLPQTVLELAK